MSTYYTGSGSKVQMGLESTFGTKVVPTDAVNFTSESFKVEVEKGDEGSLMVSKTAMSRDVMSIDVSGDVSFILRPEFAKTLFHAALGTEADSSEAGHKDYTLCGPSDSLPSLTFIVDRKAKVTAYTGCVVSSLSLECTAGEYVTGTLSLDGYKYENGTVASLSAYTVPSYRCTSATLTVAGSTFDVSKTTISIDNAIEAAPKVYSSGLYAKEPILGQRSVTVSFDMPYSSDIETFRDNYLITETNASMVLKFSADDDHEITVTMPNVAITSVDANVSGSGIIEASAEGTCLTVGSAEPITITV